MPPHSTQSDTGPIRSVKDFIKLYFPSAKPCPHCNGTGMKRGTDTTVVRRPCTCKTNLRGPCPKHGGVTIP